ncbi:serine/threonine-protein kinase, partial [Frankia sp. QA3]|uniref:serine/threonine-protein kinase n=1 Tax=Frankia sp. QA3 TaxID=710111 RepID=UPI000269C6C8
MVDDAAGPNPRTDPGDPLNPHEPRSIGPYALISRLGVGGMGTVYLARNTAGRRVAVKVIRPDLAADEEFRRRFRAEVEAARRVAPFCTAEVLDADPNAPAPYLVTEFIDGVRLDEQVDSGPLASSTLTGLAVGVATALTAIHSAGLVHRDLKPSNVMLSLSGPRVIDFGIAQALEGAKAKPTAWGFGSAGWMAPEQVHGRPIGPEADVFAWGILIAYAGTGRHPFGDGSDIDLGMRIVGAAPDLRGLREPLVGLVSAALAKHPDDRPSARELLLRLIAQPPARGGPALGPAIGPAIGQVEELLNRTGEVPRPAPTRVGPVTSAPARRAPWDGAGPAARPAGPPGRA